MKNTEIYRRFAVNNTIFDIPLVLSMLFFLVNFWKFTCNWRKHGARGDFFRSPTSRMRPTSKREAKKMKKDDVIIMNMCGRGDKDLSAVLPKLKAMGKI